MDPNQREDVSGHADLLLLHIWSDDPGRARLLAERLEEAAGGRLCPSVPVLCLQLVSVDLQMYRMYSSCQSALLLVKCFIVLFDSDRSAL